MPQEELYSLYLQAKESSIERLNQWYDNPENFSACISSESSSNSYRVLRSTHKATNFVSGDTNFSYFQDLLISLHLSDQEVFVDLGCGIGECIAAAVLLHYKLPQYHSLFKEVIGIDLQRSKLLECRFMVECLQEKVTSLPPIRILEEDFLTVDWSHATIVYVCATCFTPSLLVSIIEKCMSLRTGSRLILLDKEITSEFHNSFQLINTITCKTSWGEGIASIYCKIV